MQPAIALGASPTTAPASGAPLRAFAIGDKGWGLHKNGTWMLAQVIERRPAQFTAPTVAAIVVNSGASSNSSFNMMPPPTPATGARAGFFRLSPAATPAAAGSIAYPGLPASASASSSMAAAAGAAATLMLGPTAAAAAAAGAATTAASSPALPPSAAPAASASATDSSSSASTASATANGGFDYYVHYQDTNRRMDRWLSQFEFKLILAPTDATAQAEGPPKMLYSPSHGPGTPGAALLAAGHLSRQSTAVAGSGASGAGWGDDAGASGGAGAMPATPRVATRRDRRALVQDDSANPTDPVVAALERAREDQTKVRTVDCVQIGPWEVDTWYYSPYPPEFAGLPKLYVCEWCLKYMKKPETLARHAATCAPRHPPGTEIYRKDNISVFEIDGAEQRLYAQCLCLLAKLYIDHKTLFFDVAPFMFYVLTETDADGCHLVGFFSKEKDSSEGYNLACILTFPQHQRKGYGKFLIAFSYALSRLEGRPGSPEKPLSDLGKVSYRSFWSQTLVNALAAMPPDRWSLKALSEATGITSDDALITLQDLNLSRFHRGTHAIVATPKQLETLAQHWQRGPELGVDMACLQWAPPDRSAAEAPAKRRRRGVVSAQQQGTVQIGNA